MSLPTDAFLKKTGKSIYNITKRILRKDETPHTRIAVIKLNESMERLNQEVVDRANFKKVHGKK